MKKQFKTSVFFLIPLILITLISTPQVASASWWNPFTWFKKEIKVEQAITPPQQVPISKQENTEPKKEEIVLTLIPKSLKTQLYKAVRDSFAAEHGARMTAMHKATDNATELRNQLKLTYNKARQAAITGEILEIVGGAEALKG